MTLPRKVAAEFLGTFWLVLGGCGAALLAGRIAVVGIGLVGVALAFGLTVLTMCYALAHISGAHFNPAITLGAALAGRISWREVGPYVAAQLSGGIAGAGVLLVIAEGRPGATVDDLSFVSNGYGDHSPAEYSLFACLVAEVVFTAGFILVVLGATDRRAGPWTAPLAIGFFLTLVHLVTIPVTNTSVNPARSTGPALFAGGWALQQLWLFWLAPAIGAVIAGLGYRFLAPDTGTVELPAQHAPQAEATGWADAAGVPGARTPEPQEQATGADGPQRGRSE